MRVGKVIGVTPTPNRSPQPPVTGRSLIIASRVRVTSSPAPPVTAAPPPVGVDHRCVAAEFHAHVHRMIDLRSQAEQRMEAIARRNLSLGAAILVDAKTREGLDTILRYLFFVGRPANQCRGYDLA